MVFLEHYKEVGLGMYLDLAGRVSRFEDVLSELLAYVFNRYDAESVLRDRNDTFRASLGAEGRNVSE